MSMNKLLDNIYRLRMVGISLLLVGGFTVVQGQPLLRLGAGVTSEIAWGEDFASFYYNDLHPDWTNWNPRIREMNGLVVVQPSEQWSFHGRVQLRRKYGRDLDLWKVIQADLRWQSASERWQVDGGRFLSPFGAFYTRALPQDRLFITPPLGYQYYVNISSQVGYSPQLAEPATLRIDGNRDWGAPHAYFGGYATGLKVRHRFEQDSAVWDLALVSGAPNVISQFLSQPVHPTLITRFHWRPTFFWRQGFSGSAGGFMQENTVNDTLASLTNFRQILLGTDWQVGFGYVEVSGEFFYSWYHVPVFNGELNQFQEIDGPQNWLTSWSGYADVRVDLPFLIGAYAGYRLGYLDFGPGLPGSEGAWDQRVWRHTVGLGYQITSFVLLKSFYVHQTVKQTAWDLDQWRTSLTVYF